MLVKNHVMWNLFGLKKQCLELNREEKENFYKKDIVIFKDIESYWTVTIDLPLFREKYLIQRFVITFFKNSCKLVI